MRLYVESNFVLEAALEQEQATSCRELLELARAGQLELVIPAFSILEPYQTMRRRHGERAGLTRDLDRELGQLGRSAAHAALAASMKEESRLLAASVEQEEQAMEAVRRDIVDCSRVLALEGSVLARASQLQQRFGLSAEDAVVAASILGDLASDPSAGSAFVTRDSGEFADPDLVDEFEAQQCTVVHHFHDAVRLVVR